MKKQMRHSTSLTQGFTLLELLISMAITMMVFAIVATVFLQMRKVSRRQEMDVAMIQEARIGVAEMARLIRMAGYRRDSEHGQPAIIEAAPFQLTFNADISKDFEALPKNSMIPLDSVNDYVSPDQAFETGAETIRLTLDSDDDGDIEPDDIDDNHNPAEELTENPDDLTLVKEINGRYDRQLTIGVRGPYYANRPGQAADRKTNLTPMFQYYMATSSCAVMLLGDANCDGELTGDERYFTPLTDAAQLRGLRRVRISVTTASERKDPFDHATYHEMTISTEVALRNPDAQGFFAPNPADYPGCPAEPVDCDAFAE